MFLSSVVGIRELSGRASARKFRLKLNVVIASDEDP